MNVMKWPWQTGESQQRLVMSWTLGEVAFVQARPQGTGWAITRLGVERQGEDSEATFHKRLQSLGLQDRQATVVLRPSQYQLLQIEAPPVRDDELRAAVRWQIAGMVEQPLDQLVLDVMPVGDAQVRKTNQVFVVAADQSVVEGSLSLARTLGVEVAVIDIQDSVQRNLQLHHLASETQAHLAVVVLGDAQALLTISAHGELQYSRRLDVETGMVAGDEAHAGRERWAMEIQRSLDVWDRTAPMLSVSRISLYAGQDTAALSRWLGQYLGQAVYPMEPVFDDLNAQDLAQCPACWPLLGALLRPVAPA
jgi:MSHA biogenesis protein MshI